MPLTAWEVFVGGMLSLDGVLLVTVSGPKFPVGLVATSWSHGALPGLV